MAYVSKSNERERTEENLALYVFARCEQFIADYAASNQSNAHELTVRVARLFQAQTLREELGAGDPVSPLREQATGERRAMAAMEMAGSSHNGTSRERTVAYNNGAVRRGPVDRRGHKRDEPVDQDRIETIRKMLASGMTRRDVGDYFGISKDGVGYYVRQYKMHEGAPAPQTGKRRYTLRKPHWTQLPKNKAKMRRITVLARKAYLKKLGKDARA